VKENEMRDNEPGIWPPPSLWHRLLRGVADRLGAATARDEERRIQSEGVRRYQLQVGWRSKAVLINRVRQGWWLGPPPYGYRLARHRVDDGTGHLVVRNRLALDEERADTVGVIFSWFVRDGLGWTAIAARLAADAERYRPPVDHRSGESRLWTSAVVRGVVSNPAYLGYVVRGRTRRGRPQPEERWIWSLQRSHPPLVDEVVWWDARDKLHPVSASSRDDTAASSAAVPGEEAA
jgi:hypothetical protein